MTPAVPPAAHSGGERVFDASPSDSSETDAMDAPAQAEARVDAAHERASPGRSAYRGRFAPSPTGPLHAGSLVAALASWLDARAHDGAWLVRIEDIDTPRCVPGAAHTILDQLARCGLHSDEPPLWQSQRAPIYQAALDRLLSKREAYRCGCTRTDIDRAWAHTGHARPRHAERIYPGTCRDGLHGKPARATRVRSVAADGSDITLTWHDRRLGAQQQNLSHEVGDFIVQRADGLWAYQLAVVVDDADQHITDIVRGDDLADNTARQIHLQRLLALPTPRYLHTPLVLGANGEKLSKQNGAPALDLTEPAQALRHAARALGITTQAQDLNAVLSEALAAWRAHLPRGSST